MRITKSMLIENDKDAYQEMCSDCEAYGLKKPGLKRSDCRPRLLFLLYFIGNTRLLPYV